jgi:hypothetical protein
MIISGNVSIKAKAILLMGFDDKNENIKRE